MKKQSTESVAASSPTWETLEAFARQSMQQFLQRMLEEEVDGTRRDPFIVSRRRAARPSLIAQRCAAISASR